MDLVEEVKILRIQNAEKDKRLEYLESRLEDLEQYTRINDVIITGLKVRPRSYARAVGTDAGGEPGELDDSSTEQQVAAFLQSKGIQLDCNNIEACHPLPRRKDSDNPAIMSQPLLLFMSKCPPFFVGGCCTDPLISPEGMESLIQNTRGYPERKRGN
ncbi:hypothetical protein F7725_007414 [Dissostichus mawsoni]|uniref:Uncharacterized protein n=1 Tax=Dissostichus mawsoni TaxID=36200 RepID=A0A7J5XWS4_DISMA|nr:hypothetical protein F7725_007414 [Dissostichus mawsoni]